MFIGHLPAGYLIGTTLVEKLGVAKDSVNRFLGWCMVGALAPDIDLLYFYLFDQRQHHHHTYFTHYPIVWAGLLAIAFVWFRLAPKKSTAVLAVAFCLNGFVHLLLDSIVGDVWWLMPFIDRPFSLFHIEGRYHPWWLNFILNWSFVLEILLVTAAVWRWRKRSAALRFEET